MKFLLNVCVLIVIHEIQVSHLGFTKMKWKRLIQVLYFSKCEILLSNTFLVDGVFINILAETNRPFFLHKFKE